MQPLLISSLIAASLIGCASQRPITYALSATFGREAIELHPDGTFVYCAWSDDGPTLFSAHGTWRWLDRGRRQLETVVVGRRLERGYPTPAGDLPDVVVWTVRRSTIQRGSRIPLQRADVAALAHAGCMQPAR
jgi:hypothetical protein